MRRCLRFLANTTLATSVLIFVATSIFWIRTGFTLDEVYLAKEDLVIEPGAPVESAQLKSESIRVGTTREGGGALFISRLALYYPPDPNAGSYISEYGRKWHSGHSAGNDRSMLGTRIREDIEMGNGRAFAGFGLACGSNATWRAIGGAAFIIDVMLPDWAILLVTGGYSAWVIRRRIQARRWIETRRCLKCGYDLRASKGRCPECGTTFV